MDYQVETIGKSIISAFIDPVTFCILSNNCEIKSTVNVGDFYASTVRAFICMYYTKITYITGCVKSDFFCCC